MLARNMIVGDYNAVSNNNGQAAVAQGAFTISGGVASVSSNLVAGAFTNANGVIQVTAACLLSPTRRGRDSFIVGQMGRALSRKTRVS